MSVTALAETPLLEVRAATKVYGGPRLRQRVHDVRAIAALKDFSMTVPARPRIIAVAGESGSGKTTLANAILGFVTLTSGQIFYQGRDITTLRARARRSLRSEIQAVLQDPYDAYNHVYRVKHIFDLVFTNFKLATSKVERASIVKDALRLVGLADEEILDRYPHQLSGGQRQRLMIARAYVLRPRLIIADEPVSMIDASLRASILELFVRLRDEQGTSIVYITHDLSTAYQIADELLLLYAGSLVESGETRNIIESPKHPYAQLLVDSIPNPDPDVAWGSLRERNGEPEVVSMNGCRFYPRCPDRMDICRKEHPPLFDSGAHEQRSACYLYGEGSENGEDEG